MTWPTRCESKPELLLLVSFLAGAGGCGARSGLAPEDTSTDGASSGGPDLPTSSGGGAPCHDDVALVEPAVLPPVACSLPADGIDPVDSESALRSRIVGTWLLCHGPSAFGAHTIDVGLEILACGRYHRLYVMES